MLNQHLPIINVCSTPSFSANLSAAPRELATGTSAGIPHSSRTKSSGDWLSTMFRRLDSGRKRWGMEFHVLRPITTAFRFCGLDVVDVSVLKYLHNNTLPWYQHDPLFIESSKFKSREHAYFISLGSRHGSFPSNPIPWFFSAIATTMLTIGRLLIVQESAAERERAMFGLVREK